MLDRFGSVRCAVVAGFRDQVLKEAARLRPRRLSDRAGHRQNRTRCPIDAGLRELWASLLHRAATRAEELVSVGGYEEAWIQNAIQQDPTLLPIDAIEPAFIPA